MAEHPKIDLLHWNKVNTQGLTAEPLYLDKEAHVKLHRLTFEQHFTHSFLQIRVLFRWYIPREEVLPAL